MSKIFKGLPSEAYTDNDFWIKEGETVFSDNWMFVGFVHELNSVGDAITLTVANQPILILKNSENKIVAFHNVCSHRCLKLVDKNKNLGKFISCRYHAWIYDLSGNLIRAPHFGGTNNHEPKGFKTKNNGLKSIRIKTWNDWIFILSLIHIS